jgi:predicted carbohydrate-binding protein with CBM48
MSDEFDDPKWRERIGAAYRSTPDESAAARERLRERLRDESPQHGLREALPWWITRLSFDSKPIAVAGAALGLLAAGVWLGVFVTTRHPVTHRGGDSAALKASNLAALPMARATFAIVAPGASRVTVVGDFNGWDPRATRLRRAALGDLWVADVPLPIGVHVYAFVVDGNEWIPDPSAPLAPMSAFGAKTSVLLVGESSPL